MAQCNVSECMSVHCPLCFAQGLHCLDESPSHPHPLRPPTILTQDEDEDDNCYITNTEMMQDYENNGSGGKNYMY